MTICITHYGIMYEWVSVPSGKEIGRQRAHKSKTCLVYWKRFQQFFLFLAIFSIMCTNKLHHCVFLYQVLSA